MGMPKPLTNFNFQKIKQNDRIAYYNYIADIFKPFNVNPHQYRILIVNTLVMEILMTKVTLSAKI